MASEKSTDPELMQKLAYLIRKSEIYFEVTGRCNKKFKQWNDVTNEFIYSFNVYLLNSWVPAMVLDAEDMFMSKMSKGLFLVMSAITQEKGHTGVSALNGE